MRNTLYSPPSYHDKQIMALRLAYLGEYTIHFDQQLERMITMGLSVDEILEKSVDEKMQEWVRCFMARHPQDENMLSAPSGERMGE